MNMSHPAVRGVGQIRIEALPRKRPGVPFIRLWERLSVPILHRVIKCDGQLSQSGSGQERLSSDNVVQATGSACHMKKALAIRKVARKQVRQARLSEFRKTPSSFKFSEELA
ncbi:hypothetical protein Tco_0538114 [Tanacetum coccineum]